MFYFFAALTLLMAIFERQMVIFCKPFVVLSLCFIYIVKTEKINFLVLFTMLLVMVSEILTMRDFSGYFGIIVIFLSIHYSVNMIILWKSLQKVKIKLKKIFTVQLMITMILITYVVLSVSELITPAVHEHMVFLNVLIICFVLFIGLCYYIYLNSRTVISYSLMVAASCFLISNILTALDKLYISIDVFTVMSNLLQISGEFFLIKFFLEQHKLVSNEEDYFEN